MKRLAMAALFAAFAGDALAQEACLRPAPPAIPATTAAATLSEADLQTHRAARDAFFTAADANLACLDRSIEARMREIFATGAPVDAATRALGQTHEESAKERGQVYERFLRLCLAWEDARQSKLPGGCAPAS